jgi:hypothetical protein
VKIMRNNEMNGLGIKLLDNSRVVNKYRRESCRGRGRECEREKK